MSLPPLAALRAFEAVARHLSFTRAAEELGMTQAAVSYQIKILEERVGAPLFLRKPRQVELSEAGARLAPEVEQAFDILRNAFARSRGQIDGTLAISAVPTSAPRITARAAGSVMRPWPTKDEVISDVAVLDCTSAVTPMPDSAAVNWLPVLRASRLRRLAPNTRSTPVRTRWVPQTSRAMAASRFSRCFMGGTL